MSTPNLTAERLRELLNYDASTGVFTRLVNRKGPNARRGNIAGSLDKSTGYERFRVDGIRYRLHRLAWLYQYGAWPSGPLDHIDGDKRNNRISNLRLADAQINAQNVRVAHVDSLTGVLGVTKTRSGGFAAQIKLENKVRHLGTYKTPELAHQAYLNAKRAIHIGCTL